MFEYKLVRVEVDPWKRFKKRIFFVFRLTLLFLGTGILLYDRYVLLSVMNTVDHLKQELLLTEEEMPVKKVLDKKGDKTLTELERIKISKIITGKKSQGLNPSFVVDLIFRESTFRPHAVSPTGARGLMQLLPSTAKWLSEKSGIPWTGNEILFNPVKNVELGTAYLSYLAQDFKGDEFLRAAYQSGPNWVRKNMKGGLYAGNP